MADFDLKGYCDTESNNDCNKPLDMLAELKSLASKVPLSEGFVVYPGGSGLIMHKIEAGKLRKLLALASANDAFEPPVYVTQQPHAATCATCGEEFRSSFCNGCSLENKLLPCYPPSSLCIRSVQATA